MTLEELKNCKVIISAEPIVFKLEEDLNLAELENYIDFQEKLGLDDESLLEKINFDLYFDASKYFDFFNFYDMKSEIKK